MTDNAMSQDRQNAIALGRSFGWTITRDGKRWRFTQPDTGGRWDVFYISHGNLSVRAVLRKLSAYEDQLAIRISQVTRSVQDEWLHEQRPQHACVWLATLGEQT